MKLKHFLPIILAVVAIWTSSCSKKSDTIVTPVDTTKNIVPNGDDTTAVASYTPPFTNDVNFYPGDRRGDMSKDTLVEASGLCASRKYPGFFWTENDSGNPNDVFLIDSNAHVRAIFTITNSTNRDWEDLACGPGPDASKSYLYIGEIGDNNNANGTSTIYRIPEPDVTFSNATYIASVPVEKAITFKYADGSHNAESLMIDPATKDIYIASKGSVANIYVARYPQPDTLFTMKKIGQLPFVKLTAGDISPDGSEILLKNTSTIYYWKRAAGESVLGALLRAPMLEPYTLETQGESICWTLSADAYYTTSEYNAPTISGLWKYKRK
ncbi:MAG: hypothetical protein WCH46_00015 [bacterium]